MCDTPNRPAKNTPLLPTGHWGMDAFDSTMGHVKHIKRWKPCLGALMCYFGTNNRLFIYYVRYSQPASEERPLLPTSHWGMAAIDNNMWHVKHIERWKPCLGVLIGYFATNNRLLMHALCVILPSGQKGTAHYSQSATEEWLYLTVIWGTWNTLNIKNHVWGPWCVISGQIIVSWYMHYVWYSQLGQWGKPHYSQPATEKLQLYGVIGHIKHWKPWLGALVSFGDK